MDVDEHVQQTYITYDSAPNQGNKVDTKRVPDYFL
jgi:hypothetical protein